MAQVFKQMSGLFKNGYKNKVIVGAQKVLTQKVRGALVRVVLSGKNVLWCPNTRRCHWTCEFIYECSLCPTVMLE